MKVSNHLSLNDFNKNNDHLDKIYNETKFSKFDNNYSKLLKQKTKNSKDYFKSIIHGSKNQKNPKKFEYNLMWDNKIEQSYSKKLKESKLYNGRHEKIKSS
jgi:hypothetical protein